MNNESSEALPTSRTYDPHEHLGVPFERLAQAQMEEEMKAHGAQRFLRGVQNNRAKGRETSNEVGLLALRQSLEPVSEAIALWIKEASAKKGVKHVAVKVLREVGAEEAALLISKAIIDNLSSKTSAMRMSMRISGMLLDELRFRKFAKHHEGCDKVERILENGRKTKCVVGCTAHLFDWKMRQFDTSSYQHMKRSLDASMSFANLDVSEYGYPDSQRILIGNKALDIFIRSTHKRHLTADNQVCEYCPNHGYVQVDRTRISANNTETNVIATQDTIDWIKGVEKSLMFLSPTYRPTSVPPKPWTNTRDGGYWFSLAGKFPLLRTDGRHKLEDLDSIDMPVVYNALNALQETSWSINQRVLEVVEFFRNRQEPPPNDVLPSAFEEQEPMKPAVMGDRSREEEKAFVAEVVSMWSEAKQQEYRSTVKRWRKAAASIHNRNHTRKVKNIVLSHVIATAKTLLEVTDDNGQSLPFYFPHNLDFRGRAYAIPLYLQPQGDDLQKGLLQFGTGKRLGTADAVDWLAVHGANCLADAPGGLKLDKLPIADRVQWVHDHNDLIRAVADDPITNDWWTKADSPFCFLAFCFEWAGYLRDGLDFVSYLPIAMDGSCNGLQHYSALLRDEVGGRAVNLVPSETPQDIYRTVANKVVEMLQQIAVTEPLAADWLRWGKVDRKFVKRQVMTLPYGSKKFGFREQIKEFINGLDKEEQPEFMSDEDVTDGGFKHFQFIAGVIWDALAGTVTAATSGMEWLQSLARICAEEGLPICWTAPNGLPVVQGYRVEFVSRINTVLLDITFQPKYRVPTNTLDRGKQVSGIAPNIIHSLDASAMMLTVVAAKAQGVDHFAMIHDSYGTHAADASLLARITREEFVRMYSENDILTMIEEGLMANVDLTKVKKYPARPTLGTLDLEAVKDSKYFFA